MPSSGRNPDLCIPLSLTLILFLPLCPCRLSTFPAKYECTNLHLSLSLSCGQQQQQQQQQQQTSSRTSCSLLLCGNPALCSNSSSTLCTLGEGMYIDEVAFVHVRPAYIRSRLTIQDLLWPQPCYRQEQVNWWKNRIYAWDWNSFRVKTIADFTKVLRMTWDFCVTLSFCVYENKNYEKDDLPVAPLSMRNLMVKYAKLFPPNIAMHCWQKSEVRLPKLAKILTFQWLQCQKLLEVVLEEASSRKIKE